MQELLLPALIPLLDDPSTAAGAFPIAAQLVAAAAAVPGSISSNGPAAMDVDGAAAAANGNGVAEHSSAAAVLLSKMAQVLDDRWVCVWCMMGLSTMCQDTPLGNWVTSKVARSLLNTASLNTSLCVLC